MRIQREFAAPKRTGIDIEKRWLYGRDQGLVAAWESGREMALHDPDLADRARKGELVILPWKGGVEQALKSGQKYGTKRYLAMWQGLRGEDLDVDVGGDMQLQCTLTGMTVVYTSDATKYAGA